MTRENIQFSVIFVVFVCAVAYANLSELKNESIVFGPPHYTVLSGAFASTTVSAQSYIVFDAETREVLFSKNADEKREMASVTKLITADTALSTSTIDASTTVSWRAIQTEGRAGKLNYGERYPLRELVFPLLIESSNDAAEAIAEKNGRTLFLEEMRAHIRDIGMESTTVEDPTGLSPKNISSANDLSKLLTHILLNHRHVFDITTLETYIGSTHTWQNVNPVVSSAGFIGGKHGFTETAGRTFAGVFEERFSESDIVRPIGIVLLSSKGIEKDIISLREELHRAVTFGYTR